AWIIEEALQTAPTDGSIAGASVCEFLAQNGGSWETPVDRRTGRALLFQGSGIPMVPGAGNHLSPADLPQGILAADGTVTLEGAETLARGFFQKNRALFFPDRGDLVLNKNRSAILDGGRLVYADFDWLVDGVPVLDSSV